MDRAKESIKKAFSWQKKGYMSYWRIIDRRLDIQLHKNIHAIGY
jgi:hypothetical protein